MRVLRHALHHLLDRGHDVHVGTAATDIAAHQLTDLVPRLGPALLDQPHRRADLPGRAVAALEGVVLDERVLERMQACRCWPGPRWW